MLPPVQPESDDTGGLLKRDWITPEVEKLRLLARLPSTKVCSARLYIVAHTRDTTRIHDQQGVDLLLSCARHGRLGLNL